MVVLNPIFFMNITRKRDNAKVVVKGVKSITVEMTRKKPADVCKIEFPNHKAFALDVFSEDDEVGIALGFKEFAVAPVFLGTIKEIGPNLPLNITCESVAGAARKNAYKETYANASWTDIAKDALSRGGMVPCLSPFPAPTLPPKKFRVAGQTPAEVLNTIAEETGFVWYAIPGTNNGYFGPPGEPPQGANERRFIFTVGVNAYTDGCEIEYIKSRRIKKVTVVLPDANYKYPTETAIFKSPDYKDGDKEETIRRKPVSLPASAAKRTEQAESAAEEEYLKLSTSGFKGSFKAVGNPYIMQGVRIALSVPNYDGAGEQGATAKGSVEYYHPVAGRRHVTVESVEHHFGDGAYEMDVTVAGGYE